MPVGRLIKGEGAEAEGAALGSRGTGDSCLVMACMLKRPVRRG